MYKAPKFIQAQKLDELPTGIRNSMLKTFTPEEQYDYIFHGIHDVPESIAKSAMQHVAFNKHLVGQLPKQLQQLHEMLHEL